METEITPHFMDWERAGIVPKELFTAAGAHGFLGMQAPEQHGGGGIDDFRYNAIISEELAYAGTGGAGLGITLHNDITLPYFLHLTNNSRRPAGSPASAAANSSPRWP